MSETVGSGGSFVKSSDFETELRDKGRLVYMSRGVSMLPLIREGRDILVIERSSGRLKKYDIPLYRGAPGHFVLHRVVKVREKDYVICGDNCLHCEFGITDDMVIGVLRAIVRNGREIPTDGVGQRLYARLWCALYPIRFTYKSARIRLYRLAKRLGIKK